MGDESSGEGKLKMRLARLEVVLVLVLSLFGCARDELLKKKDQ